MKTIADIPIPDSALARDAEALARDHSPALLLAHCQRTYVFGALAARAAGLDYHEELAYVAALLHDLGLTDRYAGEHRFEVEGAMVARDWALANGLSTDEAQIIWDAIALHTSVGIANVRSPECALVHWGAGADVMGNGVDLLDAAAVAAVNSAFPRDGFASGFADLVEASASRTPAAYAMTWLADTANRCCGGALPSSEVLMERVDPFAASTPR